MKGWNMMRAKFHVESITETQYARSVKMHAVHSGNPEDNQFSEATPSGELTMLITAKGAHKFLQVGKSYYLDFSEAPA